MAEENMKTVDVERPDLTGLPGMLTDGVKAALAEWYEKSVAGTADCSAERGREAWLCFYLERHGRLPVSFRDALYSLYGSRSFPFAPWSATIGMEGIPQTSIHESYSMKGPAA